MGRSKFPGKPPKTVTRKRIKVLARPEANQSDSVTVAENIYYGLSLFSEPLGGKEKEHRPFHGFSSNEAKLSVSYVKTQQRDGGSMEKAAPATETITKSLEDNEGVNSGQTSSSAIENLEESSEEKNIEDKPLSAREATKDTQEATVENSKKTPKKTKVKNATKAPLKSVNNILDRHQRTRQLRNSTAKRLLQRAKTGNNNSRNMGIQCADKSNGNVRKFVLPVRSAHSSRVIKPNKRFIEELEESLFPEQSENEAGKHSKKARIAPGKIAEPESVTKGTISVEQSLSDGKEAKKSKKTGHCASSNNLDEISGNDSNSLNQDAQTSKEPRSDLKKCQNKLTGRNSCNSTTSVDSSQKSAVNTHSGSKNTSDNSRHADKISVPTKVLPDSNVPNVESSRVQTRSGTLSEASNDTNSQAKPETPRELDASLEKGDGDLGVKANDKSIVESKEAERKQEDADIKNKCSDESEAESTLSESGSEHDDHSEDEQSEWTGMKLNGGKVILRKARLKLDNKTLGGTEGPFSTTNNHINATGNSNPGPTATVKCGVCGAVRFYRFVKQARKFGIHSCESCRKFISKMIKRQACAKSANNTLPILQCHKGDGLCLVPPVVRSQQWNLMRCVYKARCPACWLKMCLNCYNIPSALRTGLNSLLPPLMRDSVISLSLGQEESDALCHNKSVGSKISWPAEDCLEKNLFKSAMSWSSMEISRKLTHHSNMGGLLSKKLEKFDYPISMSPSKKRKNDNRIKVRKKMKNPLLLSTTSQCPPPPPRQRIDLKGPRVKHVCRSASVALGQPLATFPSSDGKDAEVEPPKDGETTKTVAKVVRVDEKMEKKEEPPKDKENNSQKSNQESNGCTSSSNSNNGLQTSCAKRTKSQQNVLAPNHQVVRSLPKPRTDAIHTISIDFWEQYDPAEVGAKGFALIGSELFHIPAVCFLCGSGGKEPLIHCQCCCEPYHAFCLEPSEWNACALPNWCCPRCTICQTCRLRSGPKLSCIRCRQSFHHSCLSKSGVSARLYSPDRPYVCQSCIKCKSCGSEGVNVHVGNLPLCSMCFKLRQRGNYCPLCHRFYNENDFDTKMMECNECSCWVHARCEGLSDESYQILSYLPDSIEFTCSQCSPRPNSVWRSAIDSELRAGCISVIKALSKNRKACAALKWSPRKECRCKSASARRLEFSDSERCAINYEESEDWCSDKSTDATSNPIDSKSDNSSSRTRIDFDSEEKRIDVPRRGLRRLRQKFRLKECTVRVKNCKINSVNHEVSSQESSSDSRECQCSSEQQIITQSAPSLMSIKRKVNSNEYNSLGQFYCEMEQIVNHVGGQDLFDAYHNSLREVFPWFDPKSSKITGDGSSTPTSNKSKSQEVSPEKFDDSIIEKWKEEVLKAPKAIAAKTGNLYSNLHSEDSRICCLCKGLGDGQETKEGRLLYCGQNEWIHANCALWSNEVFEEIDGSLQNVHSAISRGRLIRCTECGKKGASVGCCWKNCNNTFHYPCARNVGLKFNDDKTVFCILHLANCQNKTVQNEADFDLRRAVYVELDRKKKKYAEPDKVKVMIGSLTVDCLGSVVPEFSDTTDKILPANYKCSRLYWSTVNPMKIVRYYIRTYVQMYVPESRVDVENNVTIDHSKEREKEEALIGHQKLEEVAVKQTLEALIDSVCNREVDENLAEQNNTDLLPPEIKDAIFEDLPHDLLDGISMQDIFPKMTYEDFLAMDLKSDGVFGPDLLKDEILTNEVDEIMKPPDSKISKVDSQCENGTQNDLWLHLEPKNAIHDLMDDSFNGKAQKLGGRELKRSKSEVMTNNPLIVGGQRHHQRSCSLTWSCKRDGTYGPTMKRRKLPRPPATSRSAEANVMLVDSQNVERSSLFHELRIPESIMVTVGRANTPSILSESVRELKYCLDEAPAINRRVITPRDDNKDHKRLLWQHTRQQPRILQVDGPADPSSASECSSPEYNIEERLASIRTAENIPQVDGTNDESSCDTDWFSYKNRYRLFSTASTSSVDEPVEMPRHFSDCEKPLKISRNFLDDDSNDALRIPQLDGADDISSDEEVNSPRIVDDNSPPTYPPVSELSDRPVTCKRCKCTYRTRDSYDRHLSNCDLVTTSDSDSETMDNKGASPDSRFSPSIGSMSPQQFVTMSPSEGHTLSSEYPDTQVSSPLEASVASPLPAIQIEPIAQALITPQIHTHSTVETVHQTVLTSNDVIVQTQYTRTTTTLPNPAAVLPPESTVEITEIADSPPPNSQNSQPSEQSITQISQESSSNLPLASPQIAQSPRGPTNYSSNVSLNSNQENSQQGNYQASRVKPKSPRAPRPRAKVIKPNTVRNTIPQQHTNQMRYQPMQTNAPVLQLQQQRPAGPTMILQQVQTPGIMSAYVETLQQQSGQNLQYITTLGQQEQSYKPQFIATNQLVPGAYIQAASDNLLALQNGGISVLPSVQIAQPQPTVLGTIIQQPPNAIQCGVISSEQLVLSSAPTLEMFSDSTGSMFVSSQPMYYGLETIVSNTVMSSSQFMTGAVPQVLASSYQTTTQVFQASKLMEPMVDVQTVSSIPNIPNIPNVPAVQAVQGVPTVHGGYVVVNQTPAAPEPRIPPQTHRIQPPTPQISPVQDTFVARTNEHITLAPCQPNVDSRPNNIINSDVRPPLINSYIDPGVKNVSPPKLSQQTVSTIPRVAVRPSPASHTVTQMNHAQWKGTEPIYGAEQIINKNTRPYFDSKHVSENTSMIKSSISSQMPQMNHCIIAQRNNIVNNKVTCDVNNVHNSYNNAITNASSNVVNSSPNGCNAVIQCPVVQGKLTMPPVSSAPLCRPMNRVLPMQAVLPKPEIMKPVKKPEIVIEEPTKPVIKAAEEITKIEEKLVVERIVDRIVEAVKDMPDINDTVDIPEPEPVKLNTQVGEMKMENEKILKVTEKVPEVMQKIPEVVEKMTEVMQKIPEVMQKMPEVLQKMPEVMQKSPEVIHKLPAVMQKLPEVIQKVPEVIQKLPEIREKLPEVMPNLPEVMPNLQEVMPNLPEVMQQLPEVMRKLPEITEKLPDVAEKVPEVVQKLPEEKVDISTPLKIVLQKQMEDGSYKITHNEMAKAPTANKSVETVVEETPKQAPQITSLQLLPIKTFTLKANKTEDKSVNLPKTRPPPIAVKKPRFVAKPPANNPLAKKDPPVEKIAKPVVTGPSLMYEIKSQDGFTHTASSMAEVWETVFQAVQNARKAHNLPPLAHNPLTEGLGLENNATIYLVEQLAGVNRCTKYKPKFHELKPPKSRDVENEMFSGSVSGAARAEPFRGRKVHDMFSWLASRHRQQPKMIAISETELRRAASTNLPMAMRFRVLKETSKESVGVYHSHIHGRGLFCLRDIEAGEMVIEYAGEVIRASLTDKREKYYDSKNIGCYMFKIDDHLVVDATMKGNAARFINHSCEPNCYSRVVDILGKKHILIFALRRIVQGEELTYDYKFPFEDIKIPCTCGSRRCRKYLN